MGRGNVDILEDVSKANPIDLRIQMQCAKILRVNPESLVRSTADVGKARNTGEAIKPEKMTREGYWKGAWWEIYCKLPLQIVQSGA